MPAPSAFLVDHQRLSTVARSAPGCRFQQSACASWAHLHGRQPPWLLPPSEAAFSWHPAALAQPPPAPWTAKYEVAGLSSPECPVLSFAGREAEAAADAAAVAAAEARELAARPAATRAAQLALYEQVEVPTFPLRDGTRIPALGLGTCERRAARARSGRGAGKGLVVRRCPLFGFLAVVAATPVM